MITDQQSVIWEVAGRRKRGRRLNQKQTMVPGVRMQSEYDVGMLSEEKLDSKGPATLSIKGHFTWAWNRHRKAGVLRQMMRHRVWRQYHQGGRIPKGNFPMLFLVICLPLPDTLRLFALFYGSLCPTRTDTEHNWEGTKLLFQIRYI